MNAARFPATINIWRTELGLLPVPLFPKRSTAKSFVMLNGSSGNFCLDLARAEVNDDTRSYAWSSNVGHYIAIDNNEVKVQRWDQPKSAIKPFRLESVRQNLDSFHTYLERDIPKGEISIISHGLTAFRKLWAALRNEVDGQQALKAFLYQLACASQQKSR